MGALTPRQAQVSAIVAESPRGISCADLAKRIGLSVERTGEILREVRDRGLIGPTLSGGRGAVWATLERIAYLRRAQKDRVRHRERQRKRVAERRRRERQAQAAEAAEASRWAASRPTIIKAGSVPPPFTTAPSSVFALARL